jgi:RNA polymerase sigma-70 factor (ECF subfamily)
MPVNATAIASDSLLILAIQDSSYAHLNTEGVATRTPTTLCVMIPAHRIMSADYRNAESTLQLLARLRDGDDRALDPLIARYLPELTRWASGRLPRWARHAVDTDDLVQESLIQVFQKLEGFEYRGQGALLAYLRQAVLNRIRNQLRWAGRRPRVEELGEHLEWDAVSPLEAAIGSQAAERYEDALTRLTPADREAVIARLELGLTYPELARALGKPTPDAARMTVARAMVRLGEEMRDAGRRPASSTTRRGNR